MRALMQTTTWEGFIACCNALRDRSYDLRLLLGRVERVMFVVGDADGELPDVMGWMREGEGGGEIERGGGRGRQKGLLGGRLLGVRNMC